MKQYNPFRNAAVSMIHADSWSIYADGFKRAAEILIENAKSTYEINTVIFPIIFLYRQYIELSLKEAIGFGYYRENNSQTPPESHDLKQLWAVARACVRKHISDVPADEFDNIERLILDIHMIDPTSQGSRYPVVTKGKNRERTPSFSFNSPDINLDELNHKIKSVGDFLDKINEHFCILQDLEAELRAEYYHQGY